MYRVRFEAVDADLLVALAQAECVDHLPAAMSAISIFSNVLFKK